MKKSAIHGESGYARRLHDAYFTEDWCTEGLIRANTFSHDIWEPACGDGAIASVLQAHGFEVFTSDITSYGFTGTVVMDFLRCGYRRGADIITNPPYGDAALAFIERALEYTRGHQGQVAMLLRHEYDCASTRRHLFSDHPAFKMKLTLTRRPRWRLYGRPVEVKASPRHNFAWYVWDWGRDQNVPARIAWM